MPNFETGKHKSDVGASCMKDEAYLHLSIAKYRNFRVIDARRTVLAYVLQISSVVWFFRLIYENKSKTSNPVSHPYQC